MKCIIGTLKTLCVAPVSIVNLVRVLVSLPRGWGTNGFISSDYSGVNEDTDVMC